MLTVNVLIGKLGKLMLDEIAIDIDDRYAVV